MKRPKHPEERQGELRYFYFEEMVDYIEYLIDDFEQTKKEWHDGIKEDGDDR